MTDNFRFGQVKWVCLDSRKGGIQGLRDVVVKALCGLAAATTVDRRVKPWFSAGMGFRQSAFQRAVTSLSALDFLAKEKQPQSTTPTPGYGQL